MSAEVTAENKEKAQHVVTMIPGVEEILVRIRPYNPKKGILKQRFHTFFGFNFRENRGWSRTPSKITVNEEEFDVAEYLRSVRQDENNPESPRVFDVCNKAEAQAIEKREKREREEKNTPDKAEALGGLNNPTQMSVGMPKGSKPKRGRHSLPAATSSEEE